MNDEEIQIKLAMYFPHVIVRSLGSVSWNYRSSVAGRVLPCIDGDPLKDLNAVHECENQLPDSHRYEYSRQLYNVVVPASQQPFRAAARQRAVALVNTMEGKP